MDYVVFLKELFLHDFDLLFSFRSPAFLVGLVGAGMGVSNRI